MKIEINATAKTAEKKAREAVKAAGGDWTKAEVFVNLPERGRCITKSAGFQSLVAHG